MAVKKKKEPNIKPSREKDSDIYNSVKPAVPGSPGVASHMSVRKKTKRSLAPEKPQQWCLVLYLLINIWFILRVSDVCGFANKSSMLM